MAEHKTTLSIETIYKQNGQKNIEQAAFAMNRGWKKNTAAMFGLTKETRGFKMELLSVMFFGQGIARLFGGLLGPAAELFSLFELWQTGLAIVFLPTIEALFPYFMMLFDWMVNMPKPMKEVLGAFAVFMTILGTIMGVIGAVTLGLQGLAMAFGFPNAVSFASAVLSTISGAFIGFFGIVGVAVAGFYLAWRDNFLKIREFTSGWIAGIRKAIGGLLKGDILQYLEGLYQMFFNAGITIAISLYRAVYGFTMIFFNAGKALSDKIVDGLVAGFTSAASRVKEAILSLFPKWARDLIWRTGQFLVTVARKVGIGGSNSESSGGSENDFVWRPGQGPVSINPNDTLVGFKGAPPNLGGNGGSINITQNLTISGGMKEEISRMISDNNKRLVDDIKRLTSAGG